MIRIILTLLVCMLVAPTASGQHAWTVESTTDGVTGAANVSEDSRVMGSPWDADGIDDCGIEYDVRCEWMVDHTGDDIEHQQNGVLAATFDGSQANQSAVFLSEEWSDLNGTGNPWWVTYDVHFVAIDPNDLPSLRLTSRYKHAGTTFLTLSIVGNSDTDRVQHRVAPLHVWTDTPETGSQWRLELTATRMTTGQPAMIWVDNVLVEEGGDVHFDETFPLSATAVGEPLIVSTLRGLRASPNPHRASTGIEFELLEPGAVSVQVFNAGGRLVRPIFAGSLSAGRHLIPWAGLDLQGRRLPSAVYMIRVESGTESQVTKVVKVN